MVSAQSAIGCFTFAVLQVLRANSGHKPLFGNHLLGQLPPVTRELEPSQGQLGGLFVGFTLDAIAVFVE